MKRTLGADAAMRLGQKQEKAAVYQFLIDSVEPKEGEFVYYDDLLEAYHKWRARSGLSRSELSVHSLGRYIPKIFKRKLMNRGRKGTGPLSALLNVSLRGK